MVSTLHDVKHFAPLAPKDSSFEKIKPVLYL